MTTSQTAMEVKILKGDWNKRSDEDFTGKFIYINGNGSKWAGDEEDDICDLLEVMKSHKLDEWSYSTLNPCQGVDNPEWTWGSSQDRWIDGPRIFKQEGVWVFGGNFVTVSHGFSIYTNDAETIKSLRDAMEQNKLLTA